MLEGRKEGPWGVGWYRYEAKGVQYRILNPKDVYTARNA